MFGALLCTLAVKFYHALRLSLLGQYTSWVMQDVAVLLGVEVLLAIVCFRWPKRAVMRTATIIAAVVCTWSIMNASWIIRTGTQILPMTLLPLFRDPLNAFGMIGGNLAKMPVAAVVLLGPSAVGLTFFFFALAQAKPPIYNRRFLIGRALICVCVILAAAVFAGLRTNERGSIQIVSGGLCYNSQVRAVTTLARAGKGHRTKTASGSSKRVLPGGDEVELARRKDAASVNHNVVVVVLEGVQYRYTSLAEKGSDLTPYLAGLAAAGAEFSNMRSSVTHTTKALFALLTGQLPSVTQDLAEAVPVEAAYASLATILNRQLNFRTAFFQSAKGNFEVRPGLVSNLGFEKFWARDDLDDPNAFVGYLGCDEFAMLEPISEWINSSDEPFFLTVLCSVAHDPYEVPQWFGQPAKEPLQRYRQTIRYTDKFIEALDRQLKNMGLGDKTIFCVIGDHGEAFGEHGLLGHERIAFDEVLKVPWVIRSPGLVAEGMKITRPVSSLDLTPTILGLLGFETAGTGFDGINAFGSIPPRRKVYFSGWIQQGPTGFVNGDCKFVYNPATKMVSLYDLRNDPGEYENVQPVQSKADEIIDDIDAWRRGTVFMIDQKKTGKKTLFGSWLCRWTGRVGTAKYNK